MIEVTRLNGAQMMLNSDLIKVVESSPDTMLTLIHGEKIMVRESCDEVVEQILAYRARLLAAVAERLSTPPELARLAGSTSLNPDAGMASNGIASGVLTSFGSAGSPSGVRTRTASGIRLEPNSRQEN